MKKQQSMEILFWLEEAMLNGMEMPKEQMLVKY